MKCHLVACYGGIWPPQEKSEHLVWEGGCMWIYRPRDNLSWLVQSHIILMQFQISPFFPCDRALHCNIMIRINFWYVISKYSWHFWGEIASSKSSWASITSTALGESYTWVFCLKIFSLNASKSQNGHQMNISTTALQSSQRWESEMPVFNSVVFPKSQDVFRVPSFDWILFQAGIHSMLGKHYHRSHKTRQSSKENILSFWQARRASWL